MTIASVVVASAALLFTISSFWWIHARRGELRSFPPQTFSGYLQAGSAAIRLPLSIFNDGAVPIVVTDTRLRLLPSDDSTGYMMHCRTFRSSLTPEESDVEDFAHPFSVPGRGVVSKFVEFASQVAPSALLSGKPVEAFVEARLGHNDNWDRASDV